MSIEGLVNQLEQNGVCFLLNGDRLRLRPPDGCRLPPDTVQALRRQKPALIKYLRARGDRSLEQEMKLMADPFWQAARPAGREIEKLPHLAEAMDFLRRHQPEWHWQLTEFWVERLRDLWEAGKLREFQEALRVWVQLHVEVCATYGSREKKIGFETNDLPVAFGSTGRGVEIAERPAN